jgi:hypothetical protein
MTMIDRTIYPLPENWQEIFVKTFQLAEERGSCVTMRGLIKNADEEIMDCGDADLITQWLAFKEQAQAAFAHEEVYGRMSLLKRDHPLNVRLITEGRIRLPETA